MGGVRASVKIPLRHLAWKFDLRKRVIDRFSIAEIRAAVGGLADFAVDAGDDRATSEHADVDIEGRIVDLTADVEPVVRDEARYFVCRLIRGHFA